MKKTSLTWTQREELYSGMEPVDVDSRKCLGRTAMEALVAPTPAATESSVQRLGEMIGTSKCSFLGHDE